MRRRHRPRECLSLHTNGEMGDKKDVDGHVSRDEGYLFDELEVHVPAFTVMHQITIRLVLL